MYTYKAKKIDATTHEYEVTIKKEAIAKKYHELMAKEVEAVAVEGFRQGKAPKELAEKNVNKEKLYEKVIASLLNEIFQDIISKEKIHPVTQPHVKLHEAKEGEDWNITMSVAEKPNVQLGEIKKIVADAKGEMKASDIWVPGQDKKPDASKEEEKKQKLLNTILDKLVATAKLEISPLIIEDEVNHRMTKLIDDVRAAGMTLENYASSKNTTIEAVRVQFSKEVGEMYTIELALEKIADEAKITVEKADIDKMLAAITDEKKQKEAQENAYVYASILKRQKTLDHLLGL